MAVGTGAETLQNIPASPFVTDPAAFFQMTEKQVITPKSFATPGSGLFRQEQLLQAGIVSKLRITFIGTLTVATASVVTSDQWPYNLLKSFRLSANGQNDLFSCDGIDLHVRRFIQYPAYVESVDTFPGTVGGGDTVTVNTYTLALTWEVPIAMDDLTLVGSIYAQSSATNLTVRVDQALNSDLFSTNPANATIAGTWYVEETFFRIPFDSQAQQVLPDLTRLHGFNAVEVPFTNTGEVRAPLIRSEGQLARLFLSVRRGANNRLSAAPNASAANKLDQMRVEYGGNQRPFVFNPASTLLALNNQHYGRTAPYDRLILDTVKENPPRDAILMQGVTELAAVPTVNSGVTVTAGVVRLLQETLY
jgi:hypothetical protein